MSGSSEIYAHLAENSIKHILQEFREFVTQKDYKTVVVSFFTDLINYASLITDIENMYELNRLFIVFTQRIVKDKIDLTVFDELKDAIMMGFKGHYILRIAIKVAKIYSPGDRGAQFSKADTIYPSKCTTTFIWNVTEVEGFDGTAVKLAKALRDELDGNVITGFTNFWEVFLERKSWSSQTSRIWECYQQYEVQNKISPKKYKQLQKANKVQKQKKSKLAKKETFF
ncbi:hypothetical protein BGT96224_Ac30610 [Blumeria graminis f. sp. tritici 96224]|nr:hypothetical protein BGT96224_Ac30610 [Blumeria graminis f. sp. tritici 96224]